ncbi:MAG: hypothetical protein ABI597_08735 [Gammaproteobacteria bacterium]
MNPRQKALTDAAKLLEINTHLNAITEEEITRSLKAKLDVSIIEVEQEELLQKAADALKQHVIARDAQLSESSSKKEVLHFEVTLEDAKDMGAALANYNGYTKTLKSKEDYQKLNVTEKNIFDNTFKPKEKIYSNRKVVILTFTSEAEADVFIAQLKLQDIKFTMKRLTNINPDEPKVREEEYSSPSRRI